MKSYQIALQFSCSEVILGHMFIWHIIASSTPINNKIRIEVMSNNEQQLYTTCDMRYTKPIDTIHH